MILALPGPVPAPGMTASSAVMMAVAVAADPPARSSRRAGAEGPPPEHRSRLLSGPPCRPVGHRHAPAPQAHHLPRPDGSRRHRR
jgi:hypothetical protein